MLVALLKRSTKLAVMNTSSGCDDGKMWRLSAESIAIFAGLLLSFGMATLLLHFRSGDPASMTSSTAQYAYWTMGFGALAAAALITRQMITLDRWLTRQ